MNIKNTLLKVLVRTAQSAFDNAQLYRALYVRTPEVQSFADFQHLPPLTREDVLRNAAGLGDCVNSALLWQENGLLAATSSLTESPLMFPFASIENSLDFSRRYSRVHGILAFAGVKRDELLLVICDAENIYFASDLEDTLTKWEVAVLVRDHLSSQELALRLAQLKPKAIILATRRAFSHRWISPGCHTVVTLMGRHTFPFNPQRRITDVLTLSVFPWLAARRDHQKFYRTNCIFSPDDYGKNQVHLEVDTAKTLLVTALLPDSGTPLMPLVRFSTSLKVEKVVGSRFVLSR